MDLNLRKSGFDKEERQTAYAGEAKPNDDAAATERSQSLRVRHLYKKFSGRVSGAAVSLTRLAGYANCLKKKFFEGLYSWTLF